MMLLDDRTGSGDLLPLLKSMGVRVEHTRLEYGDVAFHGNGPGGSPVFVGVEVKTVSDVLQCIGDGRFSGHQLPGLVQTYDQVWLLVEGSYRADQRSGLLQVFKAHRNGGRFWADAITGRSSRAMYRELDSWLLTMEIKCGVRFRRAHDRDETARILANLYNWWTSKEWDEHRSHLQLHTTTPDAAMLRKPSLLRMVAAQLPGVGWGKSQTIEKSFGSIREMVQADEKRWAKIDGIGKVMAKRLVEAVNGHPKR
jgi:ERCC4-type nuclease